MDIYQPIHKHCKKCNQSLAIDQFSKNKYGKHGVRSMCKNCDRRYNDVKYNRSETIIQVGYKHCANCNNVLPNDEFHKSNYSKDGFKSICKSCTSIRVKEHRELNPEHYRNKSNIWYANNKEKVQQRVKLNRKTISEKESIRCSTDPLFKLRKTLRSRIGSSFRNNGYSKKSKTHEILGCSYEDFKLHIEAQFVSGMSWENRSEWHLDHIIPVSSAIDESDLIRLNHYTNFQPLWAIDNLKKSNKLI
jgi:hypothetical protein